MVRFPHLLLVLIVGVMSLGSVGLTGAQDESQPDESQQDAQDQTESSPVRIGIRPLDNDDSYFNLTMDPGDKETLKVEIGNYGELQTAVTAYAADVHSAPNGGFQAALLDEAQTGATIWLGFDTETYDLEPETAVQRSFTVEIPEDAHPGEYVSSLVVQNTEPIQGSGAIALDQTLRVTVAVLITVPGEMEPHLEIGDAHYEEIGNLTIFRVDLRNPGSERVKAAAEFVLRDAAGEVAIETSIAMESIFPGTKTVLQVTVPAIFPVGDYTISVKFEDKERGVRVEKDAIPLSIAPPATSETVVEVPPLQIQEFSITEARDSSTGALQVVEVVVLINNPGEPVADGRLTLRVERDGEIVEDLALGSALNFPGGVSEFRQRYLPIQGWQPGTYTFTIILDTVDATSGDVLPVANAVAETVVTVE